MTKQFRWILLAVLAGVILWIAWPKGGRRDGGAEAKPDEEKRRESSRHRSGDIGRSLPTPLEEKVEAQEQLVAKRKDELTAMLNERRTAAAPISPDGTPPPEDSPEEAERKAQAEQKFDTARKQFVEDKRLLERLKQELAEEQNAKSGN